MNFWTDFLTNSGRPIDKWKHYFSAYERHFSRFINRPVVFLEIGCGEGGSLEMWKRCIGPHVQVIGIDIRPECQVFQEDQISVRIGNQSDPEFLAEIIKEFGAPDIVLDDGSHFTDDIIASFSFLYPRMATGGVYMVEDLHTAYWPGFGGSVGNEKSFIEICKRLIDELNADTSRGAVEPTTFTHTTQSIHFYDSIVAFERGQNHTKTAFKTPRAGSR
jgi:cephalosporin hydroxylase